MKNIFLLAGAMLFLCSHAFTQNRGFQQLIGKWEAVSTQNEGGGLEVVDSMKVFLVYHNEKKPIHSFKADFSKTPGWFDFTIKDSLETISLKSLILFVNDELIQWQVFDGDARPAQFASDKGEILYLRRKK